MSSESLSAKLLQKLAEREELRRQLAQHRTRKPGIFTKQANLNTGTRDIESRMFYLNSAIRSIQDVIRRYQNEISGRSRGYEYFYHIPGDQRGKHCLRWLNGCETYMGILVNYGGEIITRGKEHGANFPQKKYHFIFRKDGIDTDELIEPQVMLKFVDTKPASEVQCARAAPPSAPSSMAMPATAVDHPYAEARRMLANIHAAKANTRSRKRQTRKRKQRKFTRRM